MWCRVVTALAVMAAACGGHRAERGNASPKWTEATTTEPTVTARPACIPASTADAADAQISAATTSGTSVQYCIGTAGTTCFAYDLATQQLARLGARPTPSPLTNAYVLTINPTLDVCASATCKALAPKVLPGVASLRATTNAMGTTAVFLLGDARAGRGYAEIWDVATAKRVTSFRYVRGEFKCGDVAMLGETIYVSSSHCNQPAARGTLYSIKGRKIANVGGADFGVYGNMHVPLDGATWAFLEENARQLVIQDVAKGKLKKTISLAPLFDGAGTGATMGNPGESALVRLASGTLVVIAGAPAAGHMALVDPVKGTLDVVRPPGC